MSMPTHCPRCGAEAICAARDTDDAAYVCAACGYEDMSAESDSLRAKTRQNIARLGGIARWHKPRLTAAQEDEIRRRYRSGETLASIGSSYGVSGRTVSMRIPDEDRHTEGRHRNGAGKPLLTSEQNAEIRRMYRDGKSMAQIAQRFDISKPTVSARLTPEDRKAGAKSQRAVEQSIRSDIKRATESARIGMELTARRDSDKRKFNQGRQPWE